jgi:hypothetical protein
MRMKMRSAAVLALIVVVSAATATLAQKGLPAAPAPGEGEFVKIGNYYIRKDRVDLVRIDPGGVSLAIHGDYWPIQCGAEESNTLLKAMGLPPIGEAKPGP